MPEAEISPAKRIELKLSDDYRRAKRNHMFVSALILVIAMAAGATVKIPGFADTELDIRLALATTWVAGAFFAFEYFNEYSLARVRNSVITADHTDTEIDRAFHGRLNALDNFSRTIEDVREDFDAAAKAVKLIDVQKVEQNTLSSISVLETTVKGIRARYDQAVTDFSQEEWSWADRRMTHLQHAETELGRATEQIRSAASELNSLASRLPHVPMPDIVEAINGNTKELHQLVSAYKTINTSIHRQQRTSLIVDCVVCAVLFIAATSGAFYRAGLGYPTPFAAAQGPAPRLPTAASAPNSGCLQPSRTCNAQAVR